MTASTCKTAIETTTTIDAQALNFMDQELALTSAARA
jgi:hypothetical protein